MMGAAHQPAYAPNSYRPVRSALSAEDYNESVGKTDFKTRLATAVATALWINDMTPAELADRVGVTVETVRRWTRGEVEIRLASLAALCDALDVPADLFVRPPATREAASLMVSVHRGARLAQPDARERG